MTPDDVWHEARIVLNKGEPTERRVSPAAYLQELETEQDRAQETLDRIEAKLDDLISRFDARS